MLHAVRVTLQNKTCIANSGNRWMDRVNGVDDGDGGQLREGTRREKGRKGKRFSRGGGGVTKLGSHQGFGPMSTLRERTPFPPPR